LSVVHLGGTLHFPLMHWALVVQAGTLLQSLSLRQLEGQAALH
jgi:hypothetical protein